VTSFILRRAVGSVLVFFAVAILVFAMIHLAPGDIAQLMLGVNLDATIIEELAQELGLRRPFIVQFGSYLGDLLTGELGESAFSKRPVWEMLKERAPVTLELGLVTAAFATIIALVLGLIAAALPGSFLDGLIRVVTIVGISIPNFWLGLVLIMVFAIYIPGILPPGGWVAFTQDWVLNLKSLVLPGLVLSVGTVAVVARTLRASMLDALERDYVMFARSMGLRRRRVIGTVAFPNAMLPTTTVIGLLVGYLVSGSVIVETVFTIPGVGQLLVTALRTQDIPVAIGATMFVAALFLLINLLVDISYAVLNPRIRELYLRRGAAR